MTFTTGTDFTIGPGFTTGLDFDLSPPPAAVQATLVGVLAGVSG